MRRAIYPGSFDPPTLGHLDVIERAARLFDELVVAIGVNTDKAPFLPADDRLALLKECTSTLDNVKVTTFQGLLVDYARSVECGVLVRGLRAVSDFEYEFRVAMANRKLDPSIETVFLITRDEYSFLSSTVVREVARLGGDPSGFVPEPVARFIVGRRG
ncbi:MAG: pantetheine-phosphate adenylyltransferase [Armatimonadetes bacterium]|nr:pantetheine-phosphate adenylyltransferase [Armatimonadota bacterium]